MNYPVSPPPASNFASEVDLVFYGLVILTVVFTALVGVFVLAFAIRYRQGTKVDRSRPVHEHLPLEITWSVIPLILGLVMFFLGAKAFVHMRRPPANATEIFVIGKQWMWHIEHSNGVRENNMLHVPIGVPVKLTMISQDVLHAMYIPAFRVQYHVVPGRYTMLWFTATKTGEYHMFCNMYCGVQHSEMVGTVVAMEPQDYAAWLANGGNEVKPMTMEQRGAKSFAVRGCANCHTGSDTERAPTLYGISGKTRHMQDGSNVVADESYIRESIVNPYNRLSAGYTQTMPVYANQMSEDEILDLIAYIKGLGGPKPAVAGGPQTGQVAGKMAPPVVNADGAIGARENPPHKSLAVGALNRPNLEGNKE
ncbi:MAG TPA: cytochrome c oxidase subunit II [Fimbriimonadaceae bacterium]|nr:cytochrome c oxidase subunit II [Fimbriimonadaceae bacterium]